MKGNKAINHQCQLRMSSECLVSIKEIQEDALSIERKRKGSSLKEKKKDTGISFSLSSLSLESVSFVLVVIE